MSETVQTIIIFLGGGILGAAIHYASVARTEREKRLSGYTHDQLDKLYGPLYYYTSQNEKLLELSRSILDAHTQYFDGQQWSPEPQTQNTLEKQSSNTIELSNSYTDQVVKNNNEILTILKNSFGFIDIEDVDIFTTFSIDILRLRNEVEGEKLKGIPLNIYKIIGDISVSRPEFLERVKTQFSTKQEKLKKLQ